MIEELQSIIAMYVFILIKYLLFATSFFDVQFIIASLLMMLLVWLNYYTGTLSNETEDKCKFLCHSMFVSVCMSLVCNFISLIYGVLFYFGFVNTIITVNIVSMFLMSELKKNISESVTSYLSKSTYGTKFLELINYYYNEYILSTNIYETVVSYVKYFLVNYVWVFIKSLYDKFMKINSSLCDNEQSKTVKNKLDNRYASTKNYIIEDVVQPYCIKSFQDALENQAFQLENQTFPPETNRRILKNPYKTIIPNNNISMSFLQKTDMKNDDNVDDDLDEDIDLSNVPVVPEKQITEAEILDKQIKEEKNKPVQAPVKILTPEERRAALQRKLAEKRAARTPGMGRRNVKSNQKEMDNIFNSMNMPGMDQMMENILKGNNLEKLMKQIPQDQLNKQMSPAETEQMKKMLLSMSKK